MTAIEGLHEGHVLLLFFTDHERVRRLMKSLVTRHPDVRREELLAKLHLTAVQEALEEEVFFPLLALSGLRSYPSLFKAEHSHLRELRQRVGADLARETAWIEPRWMPQAASHVQEFVAKYLELIEREEETIYGAATLLRDDRDLWGHPGGMEPFDTLRNLDPR